MNDQHTPTLESAKRTVNLRSLKLAIVKAILLLSLLIAAQTAAYHYSATWRSISDAIHSAASAVIGGVGNAVATVQQPPSQPSSKAEQFTISRAAYGDGMIAPFTVPAGLWQIIPENLVLYTPNSRAAALRDTTSEPGWCLNFVNLVEPGRERLNQPCKLWLDIDNPHRIDWTITFTRETR